MGRRNRGKAEVSSRVGESGRFRGVCTTTRIAGPSECLHQDRPLVFASARVATQLTAKPQDKGHSLDPLDGIASSGRAFSS